MLDYDYCKKLKDMGFPQELKEGDSYYDFYDQYSDVVKEHPDEEPTILSFKPSPKVFNGEKGDFVKIPSEIELAEAYIKK